MREVSFDREVTGQKPGRSRDGGSLVLAMTVVAVLAALVAVATVEVGIAMVQRQRAQTAADAAALAGVSGGHAAAARLAAANSGRLISFVRTDWTVRVVVRLGDATATASASDGP
jgi:Flp pilus assembly protein TadG